MTRTIAPWLCIVLILLLSGCSSSPPVMLTLTPSSAVVFSTQTVQLTATDSKGTSDVDWSIGGTAGGTVDASGVFTAPQVTENTTIMVTATSHQDPTKSASATITVLAPGTATSTANPQVAQYTLTPPSGANVFIQFGTDTTYALKTWTQPAPSPGPMSFFVAGMLANTAYHMRAVVEAGDGTTVNDLDHTFTTQSLPADQLPTVTAATTHGMTPQPGIEMLDVLLPKTPNLPLLAVVDLSGNLVWSYPVQGTGMSVQGVHLLPNGHFLIGLSPGALREIDLAGNTIQQETSEQMNASFTAAGLPYKTMNFNHDVIQLPNNHWIALVQTSQPCSAIPNCSGLPDILGDIVVDLAPDGNGAFSLAWFWSSFDHLDINRALQGYPDWTHSNALLYSADDGNLLLSIRHQGWIIKIDYNNGSGAGDILWRLGYQGDFTLEGGTDPTDWFFAQHGPSFTTANTTGTFGLAIFDNGNLRLLPSGVNCGTTGNPGCYSRAVAMRIDESAKTATLVNYYKPGGYTFWGGNAELLTNGNYEADFNTNEPGGLSDIFEYTSETSPQVIWHLRTALQNAYRGFRMPSLYPGVQW